MQTEETGRSHRAINDFLQTVMLALSIALMVGVAAMALVALVSWLGG